MSLKQIVRSRNSLLLLRLFVVRNSSRIPISKSRQFSSSFMPLSFPHLPRESFNISPFSVQIKEDNGLPSEPLTFQGRELPDFLIKINSPVGKEIFKESLNQGYAEGYFNLSSCFSHQMEPSYCGLSSLSVVLNALQVKDAPVWKGPWRWWSDELLSCCSPIEEVKKNGTTFAQFACLAKCHCDVVVKRADHITKEEFIEDLKKVCSSSENFMVISFSRNSLKQTGDGHFSPIGAYNPERNMALVLDVARFKYPPYFASVDLLFDAMQPLDKVTNLPRGYFLLSSNPHHKAIPLCKLSQEKDGNNVMVNWTTLGKTFCQDIPRQLQTERPKTLEEVAKIVLDNPSLRSLERVRSVDANTSTGNSESEHLNKLVNDISKSPLYPIVYSIYRQSIQPKELENLVDHKAAFATLFLLSSPSTMFSGLEPALAKKLESYQDRVDMSLILKQEVERMNEEIKDLVVNFCNCGSNPLLDLGGTHNKTCGTCS
ncbi:8676_t:CDS:2 [Acaulospora morrowiae]|uniref:glutathione gamma-glutamylcysteinyltransferase n=1 Tax=Acaulospora morrowiae TaxID=94023 RepID=A0A9N9E181_9GLOM|nr:8676_t:CDS:2 [Acaulospora morrowiae]